MHVGFNFLPYTPHKHGGSEVFLRHLVESCEPFGQDHEFLVFVSSDAHDMYVPKRSSFQEVVVPGWWATSRHLRVLAEQFFLPAQVARYDIDCLVSNYVSPVLAPCKQIIVVHDMLFKELPHLLEPTKLVYWRLMIPLSIAKSAAILTVSYYSAREIAKYYPKAQRKIYVTVEGVRPGLAIHAHQTMSEVLSRLGISQPYLLCVSTFGKHKNIHRLIEAFAAISHQHGDLLLVLVGEARSPDAVQYRSDLLRFINHWGLKGKVRFTGHVEDHELAALYKHALAFVLPSLYEGFGLPVIEAQYFGCPVACSNRASLPEIAGDGALLFDPRSATSIAEALRMLIFDPGLVTRLRAAGFTNVRRFSWPQAAQDLMVAIQVAIKSKELITL